MSRVVTLGEIMGRLATPGYQRFQQAMPGTLETTFAGAEASVAVSLAHLGATASFVTALPSHHPLADAAIATLRSHGVETRHIVRTPQGRLGLFFVEAGVNQRPAQVIYDRLHSACAETPASAYPWADIFNDASWFVLSGITPAISRTAADVALTAVQEASRRGVPVALDLNYRSKLWTWDRPTPPRTLASRTLRTLMPSVNLLIGGHEDAQTLILPEPHPHTYPEETARLIVREFPQLHHIAFTRRETTSATTGGFGGWLFSAATGQISCAPRPDHFHPISFTVDRLGAGDAFTAGLIFAFITPELSHPKSAIAFATAAGCLAHSIEGDFNLSTRDEIVALTQGTTGGSVRR